MNEIVDLIRETETVVLGHHLPWWVQVVSIIAVAGSLFFALHGSMETATEAKARLGREFTPVHPDEAIDFNGDRDPLTKDELSTVPSLPGGSYLGLSFLTGFLALFGSHWLDAGERLDGALPFVPFLMVQFAFALTFFRVGRRLRNDNRSSTDQDREPEDDREHQLDVLERRRGDRARALCITSLGAAAAVVGVMTAWLQAPLIADSQERPTQQARAAASNALHDIALAVEDGYDVEVLEENPCWEPSAASSDEIDSGAPDDVQEQQKTALFVERTTSGDPDSAPGIRVLTPSGVVGCYGVLYDRDAMYSTDAAQLVVDAEDVDLPVPGTMRKGN